eukprot:Selendium_serpulae@DN220_c0_g1_i1.p1
MARNTRPDIFFAVSRLGRYAHALEIFEDEITLKVFVDSDFAGGRGRRSTSGLKVFINTLKFLAHWSAKLQRRVATSTVEAETIALYDGIKTSMQVAAILEALLRKKVKIKVFIDSDGANSNTDKTFSQQLATIKKVHEVSLYWLYEQKIDGKYTIERIDTAENIADIHTKPLQKQQFTTLRDKFMSSV